MKAKDSIYYGSYDSSLSGSRPCLEDLREVVSPLLDAVRAYDDLRGRLEREGGTTADLAALTEVLNAPFVLSYWGPDRKASLSSPRSVHDALLDLWGPDLSLQVRQLDTGMAVYYLCRTRRDWLADCDLVVEDLYRSPGYPLPDPRLVRLMRHGRERSFVMLAPFRNGAATLVPESGDPEGRQRRIDALLAALGRHVFSAAWHEDQRLGFVAAAHLGLPRFAQAIELVYLVLSGELCELRGVIDDGDLTFFELVYPQPAIRAFLGALRDLDGGVLGELPRVALDLYGRLAKAFARFLAVEAPWGSHGACLPLHRILFANCTRLPVAGPMLAGSPDVRAGAAQLEEEAGAVIESILSAGAPAS